ncbi:MAG: C45 family peptidase [Oricola sp.]
MSEHAGSELGWIAAQGSPRQVGRTLGEAGRAAVQEVLLRSEYWQAVTDPALAGPVQRMAANVKTLFPQAWEELIGLAEGLQLPLEQVFAWNCRGDLMSNVPDGCTTVQIPGMRPSIAHNEDGLSGFHGHAFIADITPETGPTLMSFCYPGSIPGHTFALNGAGLVQAVNNLRLRDVSADIPRMVLGRMVLSCATIDSALELLGRNNNCGGFHMTLAQTGDARLVSVEFGGGVCANLVLTQPALHANHALHMQTGAAGQLITASSGDRQMRGTQLITDGITDPLAILRDSSGPGLPIHRTSPDDPDLENTLATAVFHVGNTAVDWRIYDQSSEKPVFAGRYFRS